MLRGKGLWLGTHFLRVSEEHGAKWYIDNNGSEIQYIVYRKHISIIY